MPDRLRGEVDKLRSGAGLVRTVTTGLLVGICVSSSACGLTGEASSAISAPLNVLSETDKVVETNLQTVSTSGSLATDPGIAITSGASTGYGDISQYAVTGRLTVLAGWNQLTDDCLGLVEIGTAGTPVLGISQPGTYYFWVKKVPSPTCDAATLAEYAQVPQGWPPGDPSPSGWPST